MDNDFQAQAQDVGDATDAAGDLSREAEGAFDKASDKVGDAAGKLADRAADMAGRAGSTMRETAETVRQKTGDVGEKVLKAGVRAGDYVTTQVKKEPLLSLIGVAALGYALAFFIHSPSSPLAPPPPSRLSSLRRQAALRASRFVE